MVVSKIDSITDGAASITTPYGELLIDEQDVPVVMGACLNITKRPCGYIGIDVHRHIGGTRTRLGVLSRVLMQPLSGFVVDHINHNTMDNRRCNLRICTPSENARNNRGKRTRTVSKYKGVTYHDCKKYNPNASGEKPWRAYTRANGKRIWLGYHKTERLAAIAYNEYASREFGEFAYLNDV